jgi:hypothetical protein
LFCWLDNAGCVAQACSDLWANSLQSMEVLSHKSDDDWERCVALACEFVAMLPDELDSAESIAQCSAYFASTVRRLCLGMVDSSLDGTSLTRFVSSCVRLCRQPLFQSQVCGSLLMTVMDVGCKLSRNAQLSRQLSVVVVSCLSVAHSVDVTVVGGICNLLTPHGFGEPSSFVEKKVAQLPVHSFVGVEFILLLVFHARRR